mmetsp:Transcript_18921/g.63408  ORF Transcript_18921/g.63408 Transcript_18921/m.63408 type:complete len:341 (+) Transcript_18921:234-1256(+)
MFCTPSFSKRDAIMRITYSGFRAPTRAARHADAAESRCAPVPARAPGRRARCTSPSGVRVRVVRERGPRVRVHHLRVARGSPVERAHVLLQELGQQVRRHAVGLAVHVEHDAGLGLGALLRRRRALPCPGGHLVPLGHGHCDARVVGEHLLPLVADSDPGRDRAPVLQTGGLAPGRQGEARREAPAVLGDEAPGDGVTGHVERGEHAPGPGETDPVRGLLGARHRPGPRPVPAPQEGPGAHAGGLRLVPKALAHHVRLPVLREPALPRLAPHPPGVLRRPCWAGCLLHPRVPPEGAELLRGDAAPARVLEGGAVGGARVGGRQAPDVLRDVRLVRPEPLT